MGFARKMSGRLGGRWLAAGALLCALAAAVAVAVGPSGQPAGAVDCDHPELGRIKCTLIAPLPTVPTITLPALPLPDPPLAPTGLTASRGGSSISLSWADPRDSSIDFYEYRHKAMGAGAEYGQWTQVLRRTLPSSSGRVALSVSGVSAPGRHNVQLRARNAGGVSAHAAASTGAPEPPARLRASLSGNSVSLTWDDPADDTVTGYQYRTKTPGAANAYSAWANIAGSGASTTSHTITVTGTGRRVIQLQAANARGTSAPASASTGPPAAPSGFTTPAGASSGAGPSLVLTAAAGSPKGTITVSWSDPGDDSIVKYRYSYGVAGTSTVYSQWIDIPDSEASTTSHQFAFPTPEQYSLKIQAINPAGASTHQPIKTNPAWPAPEAPTGLKVTRSVIRSEYDRWGELRNQRMSSVSLSWADPFDSTISGYQYRIKKAGAANTYGAWTNVTGSDSTTTSATIAITGTGVRRIVQVRAMRHNNIGGPGNPAVMSTYYPTTPSGFTTPGGTSSGTEGRDLVLTAAASSPKGTVTVNWADPGDDSITKYRYHFEVARYNDNYECFTPIHPSSRPPPSSNCQWRDLPGSGASTTSYQFTFPTPQRYRLKIQAVNNRGYIPEDLAWRVNQGLSHQTVDVNPAWTAPEAPSGLKATGTEGLVTFQWTDPLDTTISGYEYRIKTAGSANSYSEWASINGSRHIHYILLPPGQPPLRRVVQLRALRHNDIGGPGNPATASTDPPAAPSGFTTPGGSSSGTEGRNLVLAAAASSTKGSIAVNWSDPGDDSIIKYRYSFGVAESSTIYSQWMDLPGSGASTTSHQFVLPTPEQYRLRIQAVNSVGTGAHQTVDVKPAWPAPAAPTGLKASLSGSTVSLTWGDPFDSTISGYEYRIKKAGSTNAYGPWTNIGIWTYSGVYALSPYNSATITVTGTERRIVQLRATRDNNVGGPSEPATASTGPPAKPSGFTTPGGSSTGSEDDILVLTAAANSPKGTITVNWSDPGDDSITKYRYRYRVAKRGTAFTQWIDIPGSGPSTTSHQFTFPTAETYRLRIQAVNSQGVAWAGPNVNPAWTTPAAPTGFKASLSGNSISLSWDDPFDNAVHAYEYRIKTTGTANAYGAWTYITGSGHTTTSATITVTGTEQRTVQLRTVRHNHVGGIGIPATASTGP